jgi:hypothetical protein
MLLNLCKLKTFSLPKNPNKITLGPPCSVFVEVAVSRAAWKLSAAAVLLMPSGKCLIDTIVHDFFIKWTVTDLLYLLSSIAAVNSMR